MRITKLTPVTIPQLKRIRVAAYARVSIDTERLGHSLSAQISYYSELIQSNSEWEYAGVFADYAVSGTGTARRVEFNRLMEECEAGNVQIILTKSISRFARNTVDLLERVRHLKSIGVEVRFERENISTFSGDGELMLTILASFAQEESRSISENVKWGLRKRYENGEVGIKNKRVFGYRYDGEKYVIEPREEKIVRYIFTRYLEGAGYKTIAAEIAEFGVRSRKNEEMPFPSIRYILQNELYIGDICLQKCFVPDPISKHKVHNNGELPRYYMSDCHAPIIDRNTFNAVQEEIKRRSAAYLPVCFTGRITCCICGRHFTKISRNVRGQTQHTWKCLSKRLQGTTCTSYNYREDRLREICCEVLETDEFDAEYFVETVKNITVQANGDLEFQFFDQESKLWTLLEKTPRPEKRHKLIEHHCFDRMIRCGVCGKTYGRTFQPTQAGKCIVWSCHGKVKGNGGCDSVNYTDDEIREAYAAITETDSFDEEHFTKTVNEIVVQADGNLDFRFMDGTVKTWQNLKLRKYNKEKTTTESFRGMIRCAACGKKYTRQITKGCHTVWYCFGKRDRENKCRSRNYLDCDLRLISTFLMDMDTFDEARFASTVESILVLEGGSLEFKFTDGRTKTWARR